MKRTLIIIASIVVVIGAAVGIYYLFFAKGATLTVGTPSFGLGGDKPATETPDTTGPVEGAGEVVAPRLLKITDGPVAEGAVALFIPAKAPTQAAPVSLGSTSAEVAVATQGTPADTEVRYVDRASGNVYAFRIHDRVLTRIGNKTLPGVQEASWVADGSRAFVRFLEKGADAEHVDTYALPSEGGEGYFFEQDLAGVVAHGSSTVLALASTPGGSVATLTKADGSGARTAFSSPLSALSVRFLGNDYLATTKASFANRGYAFLVSGKNGGFTRLLGPLYGLAALPSPSGKFVLYSYVDNGTLHTEVLDVVAHTAIALPLATLAEKCAWRNDDRTIYCGVPTALPQGLPDDWYQGAAAFSDRLWSISLDSRTATLVIDPKAVGDVAVDAIALTLDPESDVLVFMNRLDGSLWSYDLD